MRGLRADKRTIRIATLYDMKEVSQEFIALYDVPGVAEALKPFFSLQVCKRCRGDLLTAMQVWFETRRKEWGRPKTGDGQPVDDDTGIPVRINGSVVYMTDEQYTEWALTGHLTK